MFSIHIITIRIRRMEKVLFSQVSVCPRGGTQGYPLARDGVPQPGQDGGYPTARDGLPLGHGWGMDVNPPYDRTAERANTTLSCDVISLLAIIAIFVLKSFVGTLIPNATLFNNAWDNKAYWLTGRPYLIIFSNSLLF